MLVWANEEVLCIFTHGPSGKCYDVSTMHSCGPIALEASTQLAAARYCRVGLLCTQLAAARDCRVGPHNVQLEEWLPRLAHDVNTLILLMSSSWPTEAWRPSCPNPCMRPFHAP